MYNFFFFFELRGNGYLFTYSFIDNFVSLYYICNDVRLKLIITFILMYALELIQL